MKNSVAEEVLWTFLTCTSAHKLEYSSLTVRRISKTIFLAVSIINMILNSI
jgi:hypothetical protein